MQMDTQIIPLINTQADAVQALVLQNRERQHDRAIYTASLVELAGRLREDYFVAFNAGVITLLRTIAKECGNEQGVLSINFGAQKLELIAASDGHTTAALDNGNVLLTDRDPGAEKLLVGDGKWLDVILQTYRQRLAKQESDERRADLVARETLRDKMANPYA